jgi:probable H4MPT-linked C1 transfer pathway protein
MDGDPALEIDDRDHAHDREASQMAGVIGLDIGGVNTKAVWRHRDAVRAVLRPYDVVRERDALAAVVGGVMAELAPAPAELVAVTMTAELSDEFRTKREGVAFVLDAVEAAVAGPMLVLTTAGELVSVGEARARPLDVAAANWVASAIAVGARHPDALMIDVGSTTADVIPIAARRVAATGRCDLDRLLAGELVYTGALRTNLAAVASRVPVRGGWCPVASELFAISADVHLVLGHIAPEDYVCPTPDGRAPSVACARERVARLVCSDVEQLHPREIEAIAAHLHSEQVRQVEAAARRVSARLPDRAMPIVALGSGAFIARAVARRLGRSVLEMPWSTAERDVAPAAALAELAAAGRHGPC